MLEEITNELKEQLSDIRYDYDHINQESFEYEKWNIDQRMQTLRTAVCSLREARLVNKAKFEYWIDLIDEVSLHIGNRKRVD